MGLIRSLLHGAGQQPLQPEVEDAAPDEERRSAAEAALDRLIAERIASMSAVVVAPSAMPANAATLSRLGERRSGSERRAELSAAGAEEDRRSGADRRKPASPASQPGTFGRRAPRPL